MKCTHCGEIIDISERRCRRCGEKPRPEGTPRRRSILQWFLSVFTRLFVSVDRSEPVRMTRHISVKDDTYRVRNEATGEVRQWSDWSEVPEDVKAEILAARGRATIAGNDPEHTEGRDVPFEDLPREIQERILAMLPGGSGGPPVEHVTDTDYTFTDESGETRRYETLDEMPPEVRERFEQHDGS